MIEIKDITLWVAGCSITHGVGVAAHERWGQLVADRLGYNVKFLTAQGASNEWAADQILRADVKSNDIVLWGLTTPNRFLFYSDTGDQLHILSTYYLSNPDFSKVIQFERLADNNLAYKTVAYVRQVENFLKKIGCTFKCASLLPGLPDHAKIIQDQLKDNQNFFATYTLADRNEPSLLERLMPPKVSNFIDIGSDGLHPGPKQHEEYARLFIHSLNT